MKSFVIASLSVLAWGLAGCDGCGDNHHNADAGEDIDAAEPDAPVDAFVECNYNEAHDTTNDYLPVVFDEMVDPTDGHGIEETAIHFAPGQTRTVCGTVNVGHYDAEFGSIDIDNYGITLASPADVVVRLSGNGQNITQFGVFGVTDAGDYAGGDYYVGNHAVFNAHLAAGHYQFSVEAYADADATTPVTYEMRITTDMPTMRCGDVTAAANYTEANDGANNDANDIVAIDDQATVSRTLTSIADSPEPTNLILNAGTDYRITGSSANSVITGSYRDRDTYLVTTGPTTNELAIRVKPTNGTANLDLYLFLENNVFAYSFGGVEHSSGEEFATFAVNPNTRYWLWIGGRNDSVALPTVYDVSVCASNFQ